MYFAQIIILYIHAMMTENQYVIFCDCFEKFRELIVEGFFLKKIGEVANLKLFGGLNSEKVIEIVKKNETAELFAYFPEYRNLFNAILTRNSIYD
jgi:hypothetical protein